MKRRQYFFGAGRVDRKDSAILQRQHAESILRNELHKEFGIPMSRLWNMCEARLIDLLKLHQKYNMNRYHSTSDGIIQGN